jgi:hypothetical protein
MMTNMRNGELASPIRYFLAAHALCVGLALPYLVTLVRYWILRISTNGSYQK